MNLIIEFDERQVFVALVTLLFSIPHFMIKVVTQLTTPFFDKETRQEESLSQSLLEFDRDF